MGGITLDGRLEGSHFSGRFGAGADLELAKEGVLEFTLAGEAEGELGGAVRLDSLSIEGSPLTARLSAVYGPGSRELEARFRLEADPGFWLAGQSRSGGVSSTTVTVVNSGSRASARLSELRIGINSSRPAINNSVGLEILPA